MGTWNRQVVCRRVQLKVWSRERVEELGSGGGRGLTLKTAMEWATDTEPQRDGVKKGCPLTQRGRLPVRSMLSPKSLSSLWLCAFVANPSAVSRLTSRHWNAELRVGMRSKRRSRDRGAVEWALLGIGMPSYGLERCGYGGKRDATGTSRPANATGRRVSWSERTTRER